MTKTETLIEEVKTLVFGNADLTNKAFFAFHPRYTMFAKGTPTQQARWRRDEYISDSPEIFKCIMSIPTRKKVADAIYEELCKRYKMN